jgi:hypothetical protein
MRPIIAAATFALAFVASDAGATVLYKLVDPAGQVTYTDAIPRGWAGPVTRLDVDTTVNNVASDQIPEVLAASPSPTVPLPARRAGATAEERMRFARARVDAARLALADAQANSTAEDWYYFGPNNPVGMRRAPRPEYSERLQRLEGDLLVAEDELARLERELR